jgi:hypothetical protein
MGCRVGFAIVFGSELFFDQRPCSVAAAEPECDSQTQHQRAKGDGKGGQND